MTQKEIIEKILHGKIFIYPTDTLPGLGCNAMNKQAVEKIREIKGRDDRPFSVIAPSFDWIYDNLIIDLDLKKYLPGPYTLILKKKDKEFLKHVSSLDTLGVRIPRHPFTKFIEKAQVPFITTSINLSGQPSIKSIEDVPEEIKSQVDVIIPGECSGKPSTLIIDGKEVERK